MINPEEIKSVTKEAKELRNALIQMIKAGEQSNGEFARMASRLASLKEIIKPAGKINIPGKTNEDNLNRNKPEFDAGSSVADAFRQSLSLAEQINAFMKGGAGEVINAFRTAFNFVQAIVQLIRTIDVISSLLSFIPGGGALAALARAGGGFVPGAGNRDSVHALLTPGEFVISKRAVENYGAEFFSMLNGGIMQPSLFNRFVSGGIVKNSGGGFNGTIIVQSEIEKTKAVKFLNRYYPEYLNETSLKGALAG